MKLLVFSLLLFISCFTYSFSKRCDATEQRHTDGAMAKIITLGNSGRKFPEDKAGELKKYCNDTSLLIKHVTDYKNRCMKDLPKQVTGVIIYSLNNNINQLCKRESKKLDDIIESTPCVNIANSEIHKCYSKFIDKLLGAQNDLDEKRKIPHFCCSYFELFPCFEAGMKRFNQCSDFNIHTGINFVKSLFGDLINLLCADYTEESDKCGKLGSPPKKKKNQRKPKSFILPLIDLISNIKEV